MPACSGFLLTLLSSSSPPSHITMQCHLDTISSDVGPLLSFTQTLSSVFLKLNRGSSEKKSDILYGHCVKSKLSVYLGEK